MHLCSKLTNHLIVTCTLIVDSSRLWSVGLEGSEEEAEDVSDKEDKGSSAPLALLNHLSTYFSLFHDTFLDLMSEVNLAGYTPFMTAVACKVKKTDSCIDAYHIHVHYM